LVLEHEEGGRGKVERDEEHGINLGFGKDELCDGSSAWEKQREYG